MTFSEKIDKFLENNNIKDPKQLSRLSGVPYSTLMDVYKKQNADNSRLVTIRKLSKYMGCSMDYLAYDEIEDPLFGLNDTDFQKKDENVDLGILDNVLYSHKDKIDSVKNLPIEKQKIIANAVESVLDMIDNDNN